ncbi:MAG: ATP-binding cassette domain-containing protein [Atopobiaceae bacterium]|nr:ATP-binding cassette domain-containing protein [Atopobiaceae bacterium]
MQWRNGSRNRRRIVAEELKRGDELLRLENVKKYFQANKAIREENRIYVTAVAGVSLSLRYGETFGLVGESGCGKSTLGQTILRLEDPTEGSIYYRGVDISKLSRKEMRPYRREMQIIFQDPYSSLDPKMTVGAIIAEPLIVHKMGNAAEREARVGELLKLVGLRPEHAKRYPHEFSGGQRQRIGSARALAVNPKFVICDEAVSALDVSIQAQVLNLLKKLEKELGLTYLFIAHGLAVVKYISDRVGVMYLGKIVEVADSDDIYGNPLHPYTQALIKAIPEPDPDLPQSDDLLTGDVPSPIDPPSGCRFHTRCPFAMDICSAEEPELRDMGDGHMCACHLVFKDFVNKEE